MKFLDDFEGFYAWVNEKHIGHFTTLKEAKTASDRALPANKFKVCPKCGHVKTNDGA